MNLILEMNFLEHPKRLSIGQNHHFRLKEYVYGILNLSTSKLKSQKLIAPESVDQNLIRLKLAAKLENISDVKSAVRYPRLRER